MPKKNTPKPEFRERFNAAAADIAAYFQFAHAIAQRIRAERARLRKLEQEGKRKPSRGRNTSQRIVIEFADEYGAGVSYTRQARRCGMVFTAREVRQILRQCRRAEYVPTRQIFIELANVPPTARFWFLEQLIENKWTALEIRERRNEEFGKRSNGGQDPHPPLKLHQLQTQVDKLHSRLAVIAACLNSVQHGVSERPSGADYAVPAELARKARELRDSIGELRDDVSDLQSDEHVAC